MIVYSLIHHGATLFTTSPQCTALGSNVGLRDGKLTTEDLYCGMADYVVQIGFHTFVGEKRLLASSCPSVRPSVCPRMPRRRMGVWKCSAVLS